MSERHLLDRLPDYTFALAALVAPPLAVLLPLGLAVELPILGVIGGLMLWRRGALRLIPVAPLIGAGLFCLWGSITLLWAPDPGHGAMTLAKVAALTLAGCCAVGMARMGGPRLLTWGLSLGLGLAVTLLAIEYSFDHVLSSIVAQAKGGAPLPEGYKSQLTRGVTVVSLMVWPLALAAWRRKSRSAWVIVLATVIVQLTGDSLAASLALVLGSIVWLMTGALPRIALRLIQSGIIVVIVGLPLVTPHLPQPPETFKTLPWLPLSGQHRLVIWQYTGQRIAIHPWRGWGMDAARADPGGEELLDIKDIRPRDGMVMRAIDGARLPLHPHNAVLQWWMELGLIGTAMLGAFLWLLVEAIDRCVWLDRPGRSAMTAMLTAGLVISCVSYGAWQSWWLASLWVAVIFGTALGHLPERDAGA